LVVIAAVEGQLNDLPLVDHGTPGRCFGLQDRGLGVDGHLFGGISQRERGALNGVFVVWVYFLAREIACLSGEIESSGHCANHPSSSDGIAV